MFLGTDGLDRFFQAKDFVTLVGLVPVESFHLSVFQHVLVGELAHEAL